MEKHKCTVCGTELFIGLIMKCSNGHEIDISNLKRDEVVPMYKLLIKSHKDGFGHVVENFNKQIIDKWSLSALTYIKGKAWANLTDLETI